MKHKSVLLYTILAALTLLLSAAYHPGPQLRSGPELVSPAFERAAPALELGLKGPAALTNSKLAQPAGPPGLSFRYLRTIGTTDVPYNTGDGGDDYLNYVAGIDIDRDGNLYVAEYKGQRVLRYDKFQHADLILGSAGMVLFENQFMNPSAVLAEGDGDFWVADETRLTRFNSDGEREVVFWDNGCEEGTLCYPQGLAFDSVGRLYVSDGALNAIQVYTLLGDDYPVFLTSIGVPGEAGSDNGHFSAPGHIDFDDSDNLYVADIDNHRVQKCTYSEVPYPYPPSPYPPSTGTEPIGGWSCSTFHGTGYAGEGEDELSSPLSVMVHDSTLYIADSGNARVKSCDLSTAKCDSSFIINVDNPSDVAVDPTGNVFVSTLQNSFVIKSYPSEGTDPIDYAGTYGMPYETAPDKVYWPRGLAVDKLGNVYTNESVGNRYLKYDSKGTLVASIGTPGISKEFRGGLTGNPGVSASGTLYLPDTRRYCVKIYNTSFVYQNQTIGTCGTSGDSDVLFSRLAGVAVSPLNRNIFVVDMNNHKVKGFTSNLNPLGPLGGPASGYGDGDYQFNTPEGIAIDTLGNIYVADYGNHRVQKYNNRGVYQYTLGTTGICDGSLETLCIPSGVATDMLNRVYIADTGNSRVQVYDSAGTYLTTIRSSDGDFNYPKGVAVAPNGTVYVAEMLRNRIQVFVRSVPWRCQPCDLPRPKCTQAPTNLISWWKGNDGSDSLNLNNGVLEGDLQIIPGYIGNAFGLDGYDDYVRTTDVGFPMGSEARTVELWMRPANNARVPFLYGNFGPDDAFYPIVMDTSVCIGQWGGWPPEPCGSTNVTDGTWHHVALTYDGQTAKLYVDGVLEVSQVKAYQTTSTGSAYIGGTFVTPDYFSGVIDEVSIYSRELLATEIQTIFNAGNGGKCEITP